MRRRLFMVMRSQTISFTNSSVDFVSYVLDLVYIVQNNVHALFTQVQYAMIKRRRKRGES